MVSIARGAGFCLLVFYLDFLPRVSGGGWPVVLFPCTVFGFGPWGVPASDTVLESHPSSSSISLQNLYVVAIISLNLPMKLSRPGVFFVGNF